MTDKAQYEFRSVQALRGREASTMAKWQNDGWEFVSQNQGTLRTEMKFRRVRPKTPRDQAVELLTRGLAYFRNLQSTTQRNLLAVVGGLVVVVVIVGAVIGTRGGSGDNPQADTTPTEAGGTPPTQPQPTKESSATPRPSIPETKPILTRKNSKDLAALLVVSDPCDAAPIGAFAAKHVDETIAFDGSIAALGPHGDASSRYDILVSPGDSGSLSTNGPNFQFSDVNVFDLNLTGPAIPDSIGIDAKFRFFATVVGYNSNQCLLFLRAVSTEVR